MNVCRGLPVLAFLAAARLPAQRTIPPVQWAAFTHTFDAYADTDRIVGGSVAVVRDGRIVARHEHGLADRARSQRVTEQTIFHYASITKTLTAIAIMQLRDRGLLSLDDPVVRYVPELRRVHDAYGAVDSVTLRMLLSHSSGFQNPTWPYAQGKAWQPWEPTEWSQLVAMMPYQEVLFKPGSRYSYSNPGYIYLARVIEHLTGDPWENYIQKNILSPRGDWPLLLCASTRDDHVHRSYGRAGGIHLVHLSQFSYRRRGRRCVQHAQGGGQRIVSFIVSGDSRSGAGSDSVMTG